jgi:hypothetical protein
MQITIVLLAGLATACAARGRPWRQRLTASDILIGLVGGIAGLSVAHFLPGAGGQLGLALLIGCGLALGLQSRRQPVI